MTGQNFGESFHSSDFDEENNNDTANPVVNSNTYDSNVPVLATLIQATPTGEPIAAVNPLYEAPPRDNSSGTSAVADDELDETTDHEGDMIETNKAPADELITNQPPSGANVELTSALLEHEESEQLRNRWKEIQGRFVDEPRSAVQQADALVSEVTEKINQRFTNEHNVLEAQWNQGSEISTEELRKALQRYRSFFNRLVA